MKKKNKGLLFRFGVIFAVFSIVTLIVSGIATYINQTNIYRRQEEQKLQQIAEYLAVNFQLDGYDFPAYQEYFMSHYEDMDVPHDFDMEELLAARSRFEKLFAEKHPGMVLGTDIQLNDLDPEVQEAYAVYNHEYYLMMCEKANEAFGIVYTYYIVPTDEEYHMCYMLDAVREEKTKGGIIYIGLGEDVYEPLERHQKMWEAWETGNTPTGYDTFDNEYGKTYAWYTPLYINGEKLGLIGTEVEIADYNKAIAVNTMKQLLTIALILIIAEGFTLWFINRFYISRIVGLTSQVQQYSKDKDAGIAGAIEDTVKGSDEITTLGDQTATMILEMDNYMKSLLETTEELSHTKELADAMSVLATKDALTGIRNRNAYEEELKRLTWQLADGKTEFGFAVVDLNFLKRINDTYGHENGNTAIRRCCRIVCDVFAHSPVFRIGGDEFAVVLENDDYRNIDRLVEQFNARLEELASDSSLKPWEKTSAAIGYAKYDPATDDSVSNVFRRADRNMYKRKTAMKAARY